MTKKFLLSAILILAIVTVCFAADITGHWTGRIADQFDISYDFKVDGEKLTGGTTGPDGSVIPIKDGVIKGDSLSFSINLMDNVMKIGGKIKDDNTITLKMPGMGGREPMSVILTKSK
ncbi:hypothetical protein [Mucilaginibacter paludis]|uniref:Glycoside hydrolase n=1 Tax=Mucilaginibacter paludis DSM 18603 TaxID=714943 RepID=H1YC71_9SPHI|nr:hypothetical protein [Mucilaginibacter paludis]EHQ29634.1 hypothetical protein Mucpa_5563 [Mucilaginibacter paludis DSM 18603]